MRDVLEKNNVQTGNKPKKKEDENVFNDDVPQFSKRWSKMVMDLFIYLKKTSSNLERKGFFFKLNCQKQTHCSITLCFFFAASCSLESFFF